MEVVGDGGGADTWDSDSGGTGGPVLGRVPGEGRGATGGGDRGAYDVNSRWGGVEDDTVLGVVHSLKNLKGKKILI